MYPCAQEKEFSSAPTARLPFDFLHPYRDNAKMWHNTKVFNLCLIRKMGLEEWLRTKQRAWCRRIRSGSERCETVTLVLMTCETHDQNRKRDDG